LPKIAQRLKSHHILCAQSYLKTAKLRCRSYSGWQKKRSDIQTHFSTTTYAALPYLGVFKPGGCLYTDRVLRTRSQTQ
jgi:hypothetical protein